MKVLQFTIPVSHDKTIIVQKENLPHFYPHLHRHEEIQLTWVQKGEGTLIAENNMHSFWSNEIFWLGADQPHLFKSDQTYFVPKSKKSIQALTIFFNPNGKLAPLFDLVELKNIKQFIRKFQSGFKLPDSLVAEVASRMLRIQQSKATDQFIHFIDLLKLLQSAHDLHPLVSGSTLASVSDHEGIRIGEIYNYIMQHYDTDIMLEDIAKHAHMTPQAFCRYFKKHTRLTFVSFLNEVRINEACKKLSDGSYDSISTVAYHCGFNSITNFNRVFKTVTGKSPRDYVREYSIPGVMAGE
ncbi:AraC family transcriptional regulator [Filimonas effusa]|uniref:AraC family transcriptional regulator n=1 Tax=Filimonas effusa TaxID=2508721 RepID=A0A4Q1D7T7_9BACT|nr:AraC family transcriptional regulator [Filimonas effusa]RXK85301.1 AraC family transcriptional regulator [Filimonas effusa]